MSPPNDEGRPLQQGGPVDQLAAQLAEHPQRTDSQRRQPGVDSVQGHLDRATSRRFAELIFAASQDGDSILLSTIEQVARDGFPADVIRKMCTPVPSTRAAADRVSAELDQLERDHHRHSDPLREQVGEILAGTDPNDPGSLHRAADAIAQARIYDLEGRR